jgi:hypothetical protein
MLDIYGITVYNKTIEINQIQITEGLKMAMVINKNGTEINFDAAVALMDDDIREDLSMELAPCTDQEFFSAYEARHEEKYGEEWELSKENPCY